jgi:hypothetical protein
VFDSLYYPNTSATTAHKLSPRYVPCVFHGYPSWHKGYHCLNLVTQQLIISRRVVFNEATFPFCFRYPDGHGTTHDFLLPLASTPLLAQGVGLGVVESSPSRTPVPTEDDETQASVPRSVHRALTPTPDSVYGTISMHGAAPAHVMASSGFQAPGTTSVPPASTPAHSRCRGTAPVIAHPVAVTRDEGHSHDGHTSICRCHPQAGLSCQPFGHDKLRHITCSDRLSQCLG